MENPERFFVYEAYCRYPPGSCGPLKLTARLMQKVAPEVDGLNMIEGARRKIFLLKCCRLRKKDVPLRLQTGNAQVPARQKAAAAARQPGLTVIKIFSFFTS